VAPAGDDSIEAIADFKANQISRPNSAIILPNTETKLLAVY
jgi:hypothetical protein